MISARDLELRPLLGAVSCATALTLASACPLAAQQPTGLALHPASAVFDVADDLFTAITSIRELSDGHVMVVDRSENRVALVNFARRRSTGVGRIGDGPGEYRQVGWLFALAGDSSLLTDAGSRRWLLLDGARVAQTVPSDQPLPRYLGSALAGADRSGRVLSIAPVSRVGGAPALRETADSLALLMAGRATSRIDTIGRMRGRGAAGACITVRGTSTIRRASPCNPLATEDMAVLFPDGWIAVVMAEPYQVRWRMPAGQWVHGAPLPAAREQIGERDKCRILGQPIGIGLGRPCDTSGYTWPAALPAFHAFDRRSSAPWSPAALATPEGRVLIRRSVLGNTGNRYDLVDRRGSLVGVLTLPNNETVVGFGASAIYIAETGSEGLQKLRRHPWPGPGR
jgi:hypothetical protein